MPAVIIKQLCKKKQRWIGIIPIKGVGCLCTQPNVPPEQKHGKAGAPSGIAPRGWGEVEVSLRARATLTDFYSSLSFRWAGLRHSSVPTCHSSSLVREQQTPDCGQVVNLESAQEGEARNSNRGSYAGRMSSSLFFILPALGGYALVSRYLLKNPLVLHKKKRVGFYCTHISHRGGKSDRGAPLWASPWLEGTSQGGWRQGWLGFSVRWSYSRSFEHDFKKCGASSSTCRAGFSDVPEHALTLHSTSLANNKALSASRMWRKDRKHDGGIYTVSTEHQQISLDARTLKLLLDCNIVQGRKTQLSMVSKESIMLEGKWAFYCKISHFQGSTGSELFIVKNVTLGLVWAHCCFLQHKEEKHKEQTLTLTL